jgi:phenol 2-monooxygenase
MPKTDVLIAGSGSAGIFAATWLALYNIPFVMLERRSGPLEVGQADGVQCRTVEIYESFGLAEDLLREAHHILEVCFWGDDDHESEKTSGIKRKSRTIDTEKGLSHLPHVILNQARMNGLMLKKMDTILREKGGSGTIEYGWSTTGVSVDTTLADYPCRVTASKDGAEETWEAKYVLACDGAHSTIRRSLGFQMLGDTTDTIWGVMDIYPVTTFPDIRRKCTIHSAAGNLVIIPREGGQLVRFYIQLPAGTNAKEVTLDDIQSTAKRIFRPYEMSFANTFWWSAYSIGQRLVDNFHAHERVFLTGDAAHTHSPKAGQGMNVSLQDGYNIGWKLGAVLSGLAPRSLLSTYVSERSKTAADLIAFDRELTALFNRKEEFEGEFAEYFRRSGRYMAGFPEGYGESMITVGKSEVKGITVGMRFTSAQVIRFCDCKAVQLQSVLRSTGAWRVVVFAGDVNDEGHRLRLEEVRTASSISSEACANGGQLATYLEKITKRFTPTGQHIDSVIEPVLVLSSKFLETEQESIPDYFWPESGKYGIRGTSTRCLLPIITSSI